MKDFIIQALTEANTKLHKIAPKTRKKQKSIDISDVMPKDLSTFMKDNNVPDDADFDGYYNAYDGWDVGRIQLTWNIDVPTNEKDTLIFVKQRFNTHAFKNLYDLLTANGYKRKGFNSGLLRNFDDTTPYDLFIAKDYDRLIEYYSLSFAKI